MITQERWQLAQEQEAGYWDICRNSTWRNIYELGEHANYVAPVLLKALEGKRDLQCLEVGIGGLGIGLLAPHASSHCSRIVGAEPLHVGPVKVDDTALQTYLETLRSRVEIVQTKGEKMPFKDNQFDLTCCVNVLDHTHQPLDILREIKRVTRPGGMFLLAVHTRSALVRAKWCIEKLLHRISEQQIGHPHAFGFGCLKKKLTQEGWHILSQPEQSCFIRVAGMATLSVWLLEKPL